MFDRFAKHPSILLAIGILGISMSAIFVRFSQAPSILTAAYRLIWTVLLMSPTVLLKADVRHELVHTDRKTLLLSVISGIFLAVHFSTWFESLNRTSVASSTIIVCTEVIWVALGYCIFLKGKLSIKMIAAIGLTLLGSVLIALSDSSSAASHLSGDLLALTAAIAAGVYTLLGRVVRANSSTFVYTYTVYLSCAAVLLIMTLIKGYAFFGYGISGILCGLALAVFSTLLGHSVFSWCLKYFSPAFVSASKLLEPVLSGCMAALLFAEIPGILQMIGSVIILGGVIWYTRLELNA